MIRYYNTVSGPHPRSHLQTCQSHRNCLQPRCPTSHLSPDGRRQAAPGRTPLGRHKDHGLPAAAGACFPTGNQPRGQAWSQPPRPPTSHPARVKTGLRFHTDLGTGETNAGLDVAVTGAECDSVDQGRAAGGAWVCDGQTVTPSTSLGRSSPLSCRDGALT